MSSLYADFYYSRPQQIILVVLSIFSGSLSLFGSLTILSIIWRDRTEKLKYVYHRILFAISIVDCMTSVTFAWGFLAVPRGIFWGAMGSTTSCEVSGFLTILLGAQFLYNFGLALYFLMVIYYKTSQSCIATYLEPFIHIISLATPIGISIWALSTNALNPLLYIGGWCYVYPYPPGCSDIGHTACNRGMASLQIRPVMNILMAIVPFTGIVISLVMIMCRVRSIVAASMPNAMRNHLDRTARQTAIQSILYIVAMLIPNSLILITTMITNYDSMDRFIIGIFAKLLIPIQGLSNLIIFIRPRYVALRERNGNVHSWLTLVRFIIMGPQSQNSHDSEDDFAPELTEICVDSIIE
jgi:hypothetical protein